MFARFSVKKPYTVIVAVVLVIILGVVSFMEMTPDLLPSMNLPYIAIMTSYPGASPEEVETTVTKPIEQSMATVNNIENITSTSSENVSMVVLEFNDSANMDAIGVDVRESLDTVSANWEDTVGNPIVMKLNPDMMPIMVSALDIKDKDSTEVTKIANEKIIPQIESVEGVASVSTTGLIEKEVNVIIRQDKIDEINKKLKNSVKKQLSNAEQKLDDAQAKIQDGKDQLAEKEKEFNQGMNAADQGILQGRLKLLQGEIALASGEKELAEKEAELKSAKEQIAAGEKELASKEKELKKQEKTAKAGYKKIVAAITTLEEKKETAEKGKATIEASIAIIDNNTMLTEEQKKSYKQPLEKQLKEVDAGLKTINSTMKQLTTQKTTIEKGLEQIATGKTTIATTKKTLKENKKQLATGEKALVQAKQKIAASKTQLETGKSTLDQKQEELNETKTSVGSQLETASDQLKSGESELKTQQKTFKESKDTALNAADVSDKITKEMVTNILKAQNFSMPAGYIQEDGTDYLVRVGDKVQDVDEVKDLVLFDPQSDDMDPITLDDVADVFWKDNSSETYAKINGNEGILLSIQKQTNYSTADVTDRLHKRFEEIEDGNEGIHMTTLMDQGVYIELVVDAVLNNLIFGGILAIIILFIFLKDLRPTVVIACSIPISVITAIALMYFSGITLNIISLSGLAIGVGMLVDNSVVVIENIYRLRNKGVSRIQAAVTGTTQVAGAIAASTLTTIGVFAPIIFIKGLTKQLFMDMALTIAYSLLASLLVALTFVPMMSAKVLTSTKEKEHKLFDKIVLGYEKAISVVLKHKAIVLIASVALLVASIFGAARNGTAFIPDMDSTQIEITVEMPKDTELEDTIEMSDTIVERIQKLEDVETVGAMLGGSSVMGLGGGGSSTDTVSMYVLLKEDKKSSSQELATKIENMCSDLDCEVSASGSTMDTSSLGGSGVAINIKGNELDQLKETAQKVAKELEKVEGITDVSDGIGETTPELKITVNKEKAMIKGLTVAQIYQELQGKLSSGNTATNLTREGDEYSVIVKDDAKEDMTRKDIKKYVFEVTDQQGNKKKVKLKDVADITETTTLSSIKRAGQQRYITVSGAIKDGYNVGLVSQDVEKVFKNYKLPSGFEMEFAGENETINESMGQMIKMLLLAVAFIYLIMVAQFQALLSPFIVMFTIPLAFTGGFLGLLFTGKEISIIAMLGLVMLSGIVVNNGIVLVDYINQLRLAGIEKREAIIDAGKTRMRPIFMTALTTILGLSTMALGMGTGADMMQPIAIVTIGGLLYATFTTLFIIPIIYDLFNRKELKAIDEKELEILEDDNMLL